MIDIVLTSYIEIVPDWNSLNPLTIKVMIIKDKLATPKIISSLCSGFMRFYLFFFP